MNGLNQLLVGSGLALLIAFISYHLKALSKSGAIGAILIGTIIFGLGGIVFATPLLFFFISGSLLSYLKPGKKLKASKIIGKAGPRDIWQVLANSGMAGIITMVYFNLPVEFLYFAFLSSISSATADTWGTEIGMMSKKSPVSIISFKRVSSGESGGITLTGTAFSFAGAFCIALLGVSIWPPVDRLLYIPFVIIITLAGFLGAVIDSIMGAAIQGQYYCKICGSKTENSNHCGQPADLIKNFSIINNDMVNLLSTFSATIMYFIMFDIYF